MLINVKFAQFLLFTGFKRYQVLLQQFTLLFVYIIEMRLFYIFILSGILFSACAQTGQDTTGNKNEAMKQFEVQKSENEWQKELSDESYRVLRQCGTEHPGTGKYYNFYEDGTYHCAGCGAELFGSETKYSSGSGWPSFFDVLDKDKVTLIEDNSLGMTRTEVKCANCGGHLGHVFPDGPKPTKLRYCINSAAMEFVPEDEKEE